MALALIFREIQDQTKPFVHNVPQNGFLLIRVIRHCVISGSELVVSESHRNVQYPGTGWTGPVSKKEDSTYSLLCSLFFFVFVFCDVTQTELGGLYGSQTTSVIITCEPRVKIWFQ